MASSYTSPGVYVEEVPSAIKPIAGVSTSTPAFVSVFANTVQLLAPTDAVKDKPPTGPTPASKLADFVVPTPAGTVRLITSWSQFTAAFGDLIGDASLPANTTATAWDANQHNLAHAVYGFFNNGGGRCYVVRSDTTANLGNSLAALEAIDDISLVAAPGLADAGTWAALTAHCAKVGGRFAILDGPASADLTKFSSTGTPPTMPGNSDLAAFYFPRISVFDPATELKSPDGDGTLAVPVSGHIAGIYARVDDSRGVHKAPANEVVIGALGVTQAISKGDQSGLNTAGINCIRGLNGNILVWGARTVGGDANADLKYINVRRTLLFLRKSIEEGTQWVVFEPNTPVLWAQIVRSVTGFLTSVWRSGALVGDTAAQAFYVKCDADTNPEAQRLNGQVVTEIGVAIARPAEFVVFRISQIAG